MGDLARLPSGKKLGIELVRTPQKLSSVLDDLKARYGIDLRRDSTLVIVNGVEARALEDLDTMIESGDDVVLLPMFHGG